MPGDVLGRVQQGPAGGQRAARRRVLVVGVPAAERDHRFGASLQHGPLSGAAEDQGSGAGQGDLFLTGQRRVQQVHDDEVGEMIRAHLRQLLGGARHIQGGADPDTGLVEHAQPSAGQELLRAVHRRQADTPHFARVVPERAEGHEPRVLPGLAGRAQPCLVRHRLTRVQDPHDRVVEPLEARQPPQPAARLPHPSAHQHRFRPVHRRFHGGVHGHSEPVLIEERHRDGELLQRPPSQLRRRLRHRGRQKPLGFARQVQQRMRLQLQRHAVTVPMPYVKGAAPVARLGEAAPGRGRKGTGQQRAHPAAQHLPGLVSEQATSTGTPRGDQAPGIHRGRGDTVLAHRSFSLHGRSRRQ